MQRPNLFPRAYLAYEVSKPQVNLLKVGKGKSKVHSFPQMFLSS